MPFRSSAGPKKSGSLRVRPILTAMYEKHVTHPKHEYWQFSAWNVAVV
jgi:hypothetical protein